MGEDTKYVPEGVFLVCDKGDIPTQLICDAHPINIYSVKYADEDDNKPILNIQSFGTCKTLGTCAPPPGFTWINIKEDVRLHGSKPLLETSECLCPAGAGRIKIFLDEYAAFLAAENNSESSFVSEPISSKALGAAGLGLFGPVLSMLAPDFTEGVGRGIKKGAEGTWNFLTRDMWQAETWEGLGRTAVVAAVYGLNANKPAGTIQSDMMLRSLDNRFGTSFVPTRDALATGIERGVSHAIEDVKRGNWGEVGESVGQIEYAVVEAVVGTKGAGLALEGAKAATVAAVGAQRLARIAAATSRVMQRMRSVSGIVRIGRKKDLIFRSDDFAHIPTGRNPGTLKSHLDGEGNLRPANPNGKTTPTQHVRGSEPAKSDSPYTSFSDAGGNPKHYGDNTITVDRGKLKADIETGKVQGVEIIEHKDLLKMHDDAIATAQTRYNNNPTPKNLERLERARMDRANSVRDNEVLIKGTVPARYIKTKP